MFCPFANALSEWNVTKTNSCVYYMSLVNKYPYILVCYFHCCFVSLKKGHLHMFCIVP